MRHREKGVSGATSRKETKGIIKVTAIRHRYSLLSPDTCLMFQSTVTISQYHLALVKCPWVSNEINRKKGQKFAVENTRSWVQHMHVSELHQQLCITLEHHRPCAWRYTSLTIYILGNIYTRHHINIYVAKLILCRIHKVLTKDTLGKI